jgi:hypothetical protein
MKPRNYARENELYKSKPEQVKLREIRNAARQEAIKEGKAHVGDGTSVDHIDPLSKGGSRGEKNQRIVPFDTNSSFSRYPDRGVKKNVPTKRK